MILPAVVALASLIKPILFGAVSGAAISGAADTIGSTFSDYHEHGEITVQMVAENLGEAAPAAMQGAVAGAAFSGVLHLAAPLVQTAGSVVASEGSRIAPGAVDDIARIASTAGDDIGRFARNTADDFGNTLGRVGDDIGKGINKVTTSVGSTFNYMRNFANARIFDRLPITLPKQGYVYVIDDAAAGSTKIGISGNLPQRIKQLESTVGRELNYVCIISTTTARALEKTLHETFAAQRIPAQRMPNVVGRTEWFNLNPAQIQQACSY